jgi:hypothetical protein
MKTPTLIGAIERDLDAGRAAVIQIISTGETPMERRLSEFPSEEWGDVQVDINTARICPRLSGAQLPDATLRAVHRQRGQSLLQAGLSRRPAGAVSRCRRTPRSPNREACIARPIQGAPDQIVQRFGTEMVAEVTGRSCQSAPKTDPLSASKIDPFRCGKCSSAAVGPADPAVQAHAPAGGLVDCATQKGNWLVRAITPCRQSRITVM